MKPTMQRFQGEAALLIARGGKSLALVKPAAQITESWDGVKFYRHDRHPLAEIVQLSVNDPLLAVYFPGANELITLPAQVLIDFANAERLRRAAEDETPTPLGEFTLTDAGDIEPVSAGGTD